MAWVVQLLAELSHSCPTCARTQRQPAEPLIPSQLPSLPWQRVAAVFFKYRSQIYLLVVDYYSRFIELALMTSCNDFCANYSSSPLHFARLGIPEKIVTDNGTQFSSHDFEIFAKNNNIKHTTISSLGYTTSRCDQLVARHVVVDNSLRENSL